MKEDECLENNWLTSDIISNPSLSQEKALVLSRFLKPKKGFSKWKELENLAMGKYFKGLCRKCIGEDRTELIVRLEGPTFMTLKRSQRVTFVDKLGSIGGTLGLFSGFSLLAIMELIHWIFKIINSLIVSRK